MAETILHQQLAISKWSADYFTDYVRESRFKPYMGRSKTDIIVVKKDLVTEAGKTINIPTVRALKGSGVSGSQVLKGNEEDLGTANMPITVDWRRNGVKVPKSESYKTAIDLLDAARTELKRWDAVMLRADIIREFGAITVNDATQTSVPFVDASEPQRDAWTANNADRVLFGKDVANNVGNDHSVALANIDTTNDRMSAQLLLKAKRLAKRAKITPYTIDDGREFFVAFVDSPGFRDLENDPDIKAADTYARERGTTNNPIFQGGDLLYRGIIIREEEELPIYTGVGQAGSDVAPAYFCGGGAVGAAWGQEPTPITDRDEDYKFRPAVAIEELLGVKKIAYDGVQRGVFTLYHSAPADS